MNNELPMPWTRYELGRDVQEKWIQGYLEDGRDIREIMQSEGEQCLHKMRLVEEKLSHPDVTQEEREQLLKVKEWLRGRMSCLD
jgi:hypothetical protein